MLLVDADRAGLPGHIDDLLRSLPGYTLSNRLNILTRLGDRGHTRFADALDVVLGSPAADLATLGDVAEGLFNQLGAAVLEHAPDRMARLVRRLPANVDLLSSLAYKAILAAQRDEALLLYDRLLALPIPDAGDERTNYLRALNNACIQAHGARAYETAVRIADRAQPVAHDNPYIFHSAACAYAAVGAFEKSLEQVKLAIAHDYDHLAKLEVDPDLGELLEWPELKAAFRDWRNRQEGN
jgi:tetratricopeptide (TPR) repeat protein